MAVLASAPVDAAQAIAELTEISTQVRAAVLFDAAGKVVAASVPDLQAQELVRAARELLDAAGKTRASTGEAGVNQLEAVTAYGSVFVVRDGDRLVAATTGPDPTGGLVFYDLRTCLRNAGSEEPEPEKPKRGRRPKAASEEDDAAS